MQSPSYLPSLPNLAGLAFTLCPMRIPEDLASGCARAGSRAALRLVLHPHSEGAAFVASQLEAPMKVSPASPSPMASQDAFALRAHSRPCIVSSCTPIAQPLRKDLWVPGVPHIDFRGPWLCSFLLLKVLSCSFLLFLLL